MKRTFTVTLDENEAATVRRMAELTGRPAGQIVRELVRSNPAFPMTVSLATAEFDYLDGETGLWSTNRKKQDRQLHSYAASLLGLKARHRVARVKRTTFLSLCATVDSRQRKVAMCAGCPHLIV